MEILFLQLLKIHYSALRLNKKKSLLIKLNQNLAPKTVYGQC
jgi:hypothetical protein